MIARTVTTQPPVTLAGGWVVMVLAHDLNGNPTAGLEGSIMGHDGENRPLSVAFGGVKTCDAYGADVARLKMTRGLTPAASCPTGPVGAGATAYFANVEVMGCGKGGRRSFLGARCIPADPGRYPADTARRGPSASCTRAWNSARPRPACLDA